MKNIYCVENTLLKLKTKKIQTSGSITNIASARCPCDLSLPSRTF